MECMGASCIEHGRGGGPCLLQLNACVGWVGRGEGVRGCVVVITWSVRGRICDR